jgi:hypothetical protein
VIAQIAFSQFLMARTALVVRVSFASSLPLSGTEGGTKRVVIPGAMAQPIDVGWKAVGSDYLTVMGTQLIRGRDFDRWDSKGSVVVNQTMARQVWGGPDAAMGKVFRVDGEDLHVPGVAENGKYNSLRENAETLVPFMFIAVPLAKGGEGTLLIETSIAPLSLAGNVQSVIRNTQPDVVVMSINTLRQHLRLALFPDRIAAGFVGIIATLGMFLAGVEPYGLVSYRVTRRTHEIGIRIVMGATSADVFSMVIRETLTRVAIGALIGLAAALAAARIAASALYHVSPADPISIAAAVLAVAADRAAGRVRSRSPRLARRSHDRAAAAQIFSADSTPARQGGLCAGSSGSCGFARRTVFSPAAKRVSSSRMAPHTRRAGCATLLPQPCGRTRWPCRSRRAFRTSALSCTG